MGFKSYLTDVEDMIDRANDAALEEIADFARQKARDRAPVQSKTSADGVYTSKQREPKERDPGTYRETIKSSYGDGRAIVGTDDLLGVFLETGTRTAPAYPHIQPAFEENAKEIQEIVEKEYHQHVD